VAQVKLVTLYTAAVGLNTRLDPQRLTQGVKDHPGLVELSQAVNISIDDRGLVSLRNGDTLAQAGEFHSLFCDGGDCFVVQERSEDAAIMRVVSLSPVVLEGVRSGLAKGQRMAWCQVNDDTLYSNGLQNGFISSRVSYPWPAGTYTGPDADISFETSAPVADHIGFVPGGQLLLAEGPAVWINHYPFQFGLFSKRHGYIGFDSDVAMLATVRDGFFASDANRTWFFRKQEGWYNYRQELVENAPVQLGSLAHDKVPLRDAGIDANGFGRIWASARGVCLGMDDGGFVNLTEEKINYPTGYVRGACLVRDKKVIHSVY
jgi:hypothetical protein